MMARIVIIPSHWALTEETERMAQKNKWKQSNAKITAVRILSGRGDGVDDTSTWLSSHAGGHERRGGPDPANSSGEGCISS